MKDESVTNYYDEIDSENGYPFDCDMTDNERFSLTASVVITAVVWFSAASILATALYLYIYG